MNNYAIIQKGKVTNIIVWDGDLESWQVPEGQNAVLLDEERAVSIGDAYRKGAFVLADRSSQAIAPAPEEIQIRNKLTRDALLSIATREIDTLQDAVDLGRASMADQEKQLAWRAYRVDVNTVDLTDDPASWPDMPGNA